ncbi:acetate--CoA ligase family protein [Chloroflexota bacterium]
MEKTMAKISGEKETKDIIESMKALLQPNSIAVIGASQRRNTIGNTLFHNILHQEFQGVVYPVNPNSPAVASVKTYSTVLDIPGEVEMAVIITPAPTVAGILEECGQKGVRGVVIISAHFGESGPEGIKRQQEIVKIARRYKMRMVGPNCMGVINTAPECNMNATFSPVFPPPGNIALGTQSGGLGQAIIGYAKDLNLGLSTFVSIGNRADVSSNDLLQYWAEDGNTDVILLYLESFGNPRKFASIARELTRRKPIIAVKSGRTSAGSRAAASHTGALATATAASDALFKQTGIIRVDTLEELFDVAMLFAYQPIPLGRRVAVLTDGGGPGILTADACASRGLELPVLSEELQAKLREIAPSAASTANPIDVTAEVTADHYGRILSLLAQEENIDIVIVIFIPPVMKLMEEVAAAIQDVAPEFRRRNKTLVASFMGQRGSHIKKDASTKYLVPSYSFPEVTATAIARACEYRDWLNRPVGEIPEISNIKVARGRQIVEAAMKKNAVRPLWLDSASVTGLLKAYGINAVASLSVTSIEAAMDVADEIGYPVAAKLFSDTITHKTDIGGVELGLRSSEEVRRAYKDMQARLTTAGREREMQGVTLQHMVQGGVEVIVGMAQDSVLGPLMMFGLGGIQAELFKDVTFRVHPLTDVDAREMINSVQAYKMLAGWRGSPPSDIEALEQLLLRVSAMVTDLPEIVELDFNPVVALEKGKGCVVVDARILVS